MISRALNFKEFTDTVADKDFYQILKMCTQELDSCPSGSETAHYRSCVGGLREFLGNGVRPSSVILDCDVLAIRKVAETLVARKQLLPSILKILR